MLEFKNVEKSYRAEKVIENINMKIYAKEITVLIGPSGCGKTTCLKLINKLIKPTAGEIFFNDVDISKIDTIELRRKMGYVIQQTGLFPHMTVEENIEIIPRLMKLPTEKVKAKTLELMDMIGLDGGQYLHRYPVQLSGGQQQRIGVARAFALDPEVVLMDEPFSALDPISKNQLQDELVELQDKLQKSIVFVTHDMDEAIKIADRVCIMNMGKILQYDTPENILKYPTDDFVREFVGSKRIWNNPNMIKARDIMMNNPVVTTANTSIMRAVEMMVIKKVDSLVVTDDKRRLLGIVSASALDGKISAETKVCKIMKEINFKISPDDNIINLLKTVTDNKLSVLPVVDEDNILLGLITRGSLISTLSRQFIEEGA
ncbi:MAG: ABC transporter ATP-binding protein, partial [Oscillospiraceae bacterium]